MVVPLLQGKALLGLFTCFERREGKRRLSRRLRCLGGGERGPLLTPLGDGSGGLLLPLPGGAQDLSLLEDGGYGVKRPRRPVVPGNGSLQLTRGHVLNQVLDVTEQHRVGHVVVLAFPSLQAPLLFLPARRLFVALTAVQDIAVPMPREVGSLAARIRPRGKRRLAGMAAGRRRDARLLLLLLLLMLMLLLLLVFRGPPPLFGLVRPLFVGAAPPSPSPLPPRPALLVRLRQDAQHCLGRGAAAGVAPHERRLMVEAARRHLLQRSLRLHRRRRR